MKGQNTPKYLQKDLNFMCKTDKKNKKLYYFFSAQQNVPQKPRKLNDTKMNYY